MNKFSEFTVQFTRNHFFYLRFMFNLHKITPVLSTPCYATSVDAIDAFTVEMVQRHRTKARNIDTNSLSIQYYKGIDNNTSKEVSQMTMEELDNTALQFMTKNKDKKLLNLISECIEANKNLSDIAVKKLFRNFSMLGKSDIVEVLQNYCLKVDPCVYRRNGEFMHYLAKSQCMKGNADKGLKILKGCYKKYDGLRSFYRIIFRELIQDSVLNRSEASLVIFKKYVLEFSTKYGDHYPLVCFWHLCWSSSWFSDQMLSNELLEASTRLQDIVKDKATAFSISILKQEFNEDAVVRLLQTMLKYKMIDEYAKVLQVLFSYKLRNRDIRGCTEIIRNCEILGITLSSDQQGRYIRLLIDGKVTEKQPAINKPPANFKLKW